jgi:hypothetical protein
MRQLLPAKRALKRLAKFVSKGARIKRVKAWREKKEALQIAKEKEIRLKKAKTELHSINVLRERIARDLTKLKLPDLITAERTLANYTIRYDEFHRSVGGNYGDALDSLQQVRARIKEFSKQRLY